MKKPFLLLLFLSIFSTLAWADSWDDFSNVDRMWDGQKTITNQEFEQVMDALQENEKKKEEKQKKKKVKKFIGGGKSLHSDSSSEINIGEMQIDEDIKEELIINIPVDLVWDNNFLEKGFYKVVGEREKDSNKVSVKFYQSQFLKGELVMIETEDDFNEESLDFAKVIPHDENFVKIIFGSIDFNAYCFVHYINK